MRLRRPSTLPVLASLATLAAVAASLAVPAQAAAPTVTADRRPTALAGSRTGLTSVLDVATDRQGRVYGLTPTRVRIFGASARGDVAPARSISLTPPAGQKAARLSLDAAGWLYVLNLSEDQTEGSIAVVAPGAAKPRATYDAHDLGLEGPLDLAGVGSQVAVADWADSSVKIYSLRTGGFEDYTPVRQLDRGSASPTRIDGPTAIDADVDGRLALAGQGWASVFAPGADSLTKPDTAPRQYVAGSRTGLGDDDHVRPATGVGLDRHHRLLVGNVDLYATSDDGVSFATRDPRVLAFAAGATGNVAPQAQLRGTRNGLGAAFGLDVAPSGVLLTNRYDPDAGRWAAGISRHRALGPYAKPGRPASLAVGGTKASARRTVSWKSAATDPDVPVRSYLVSVVCGSRTVLDTAVGASRRSVTVSLGTVRRGTCSARVRARSAVGTGATASRSFTVER